MPLRGAPLRTLWALALAAGTAAAGLGAQAEGPGSHPRLPEAAGLIQQGQLDSAITLLENLLRDDPSDVEARVMLGTALSLVPRRNEAVEVLLRALELGPDNAQVHSSAGAAFARLGEYDAALQVLERAVSIDPALGDAHVSMALILASREEFDRAAEHIAQALELESDQRKRARLHYLNGQLHGERGQLEAARAEFERSVALDPRSGEACLALGIAHKRLLQDDEAYAMFRRAVELAPGNSSARYQLAVELSRRGDASAAAEHLVRAHELSPADQAILYNLSRALHRAGRREESRRYRDRLERMIASDDRARENELASAKLHGEAVRLEGSGDYAAALDKYRQVLRFAPLSPVARRNMALVLCRLGRWSEGVEELEAILRDNPDDAETARTLAIVLDQARSAGAGPPPGSAKTP